MSEQLIVPVPSTSNQAQHQSSHVVVNVNVPPVTPTEVRTIVHHHYHDGRELNWDGHGTPPRPAIRWGWVLSRVAWILLFLILGGMVLGYVPGIKINVGNTTPTPAQVTPAPITAPAPVPPPAAKKKAAKPSGPSLEQRVKELEQEVETLKAPPAPVTPAAPVEAPPATPPAPEATPTP